MTATAPEPDEVRLEAARLAFALIRFAQVSAHPTGGSRPRGAPDIGTEAFVFGPSWRPVPRDEVATFLASLPSPALLAQTTSRGGIALTLLHELSGDRRKWAEKTFSNVAPIFEESTLAPTARVLVEFDDESHIFSFAAVREWSRRFAVSVGWNLVLLKDDPRAEACLKLVRSDFKPFKGASSLLPPHWKPKGDS